jgi:hypothetical protein
LTKSVPSSKAWHPTDAHYYQYFKCYLFGVRQLPW